MNKLDVPVNTLDAAEKTPNIVRQPERIFWTRAWIICWRHCNTCTQVLDCFRLLTYHENLPCLGSPGWRYVSSYTRRVSRSLSGT
jgi:hypothetical protein